MIEKNHPPIKYGNTGVLIVNLGTPDSTNWFDIRKYLKEFLSDRRVIEVNPLIWQIILNMFILNFRPCVTVFYGWVIFFNHLKSFTILIKFSTISGFVSGRIPWPRLNIYG